MNEVSTTYSHASPVDSPLPPSLAVLKGCGKIIADGHIDSLCALMYLRVGAGGEWLGK